jgi:hypothetical protein
MTMFDYRRATVFHLTLRYIEDIPWTTPDCWANLVVSKIPFGPALCAKCALVAGVFLLGKFPIFRVKARLRCRREQVFF